LVAGSANARFLKLQDGYLYWIDESNDLRRVSVDGGAAETIAAALPVDDKFQYAIFEGRLLLRNGIGLYWQPFGGAPVLLLPRSDIAGISAITRDAIVIATQSGFDPNVSRASILRVPWTGGPVETIYETTIEGYAPSVALSAVVRGATTYIIRTVTIHFLSTMSTLIVLRNGVARERYSAAIKPLQVVAADEDEITVGQWINGGGMRLIVRLCADAPRMRAVR
jgi:hypothetical protein